MFSATDYDKLQQLMEESAENKQLLTKLLTSHRMEISAISHEIRNPLTLVYSTLQLIESQHPEVNDYLHWDEMRRDMEYMNALLDDLSAYNNHDQLKLSSVDSNTFLKTVALSFAASIIHTDIQFTSAIPPQLPSVRADAVKLRQLLLNLLTNAKDAVYPAPLKDRTPSIFLEAIADRQSLTIRVKDNGCGISPDKLDHIFEPFVTHKQHGTGLGLAISAGIAKAHNGTLTVSSIPGSSTVFTLTLPVQDHSENETR